MTNALNKKQREYLIKACDLHNGYIFALKFYLIQDVTTVKFSHHEYTKQKKELLAGYSCYESRHIFMGSVTLTNDFKALLLMHETEAVYETMTLSFCKFGVKGVHKALMCKGSSLYCLTFRHRASCILEQAFHYSPENAFYIFNQQIYFII